MRTHDVVYQSRPIEYAYTNKCANKLTNFDDYIIYTIKIFIKLDQGQ